MKLSESEADVAEATNLHLIQTLQTSIPNTLSFKSKWSLITSKLSDLTPLLTSLPNTPLTLSLMTSLSHTLTQALSLSFTCHVTNPPKLKTQNDVDSLISRLNNHIHDADVILKSDDVMATSNDVITSKRESTRAECRSIMTRLQIGESRDSALDSLMSLLNEDDKHVLISVAQGVVPVLVKLLDNATSSPGVKEKTVTVLAKVALVESSRHVLIGEGLLLLHPLIRLLESGSSVAKERACVVLNVLSCVKDNARVISSRGGVGSLLELCESGTPSSRNVACGVLRNLSSFVDVRGVFVEEGAVEVLLRVVKSGTVLAQEYGFGCLSNLVREDDDLKVVVVRSGVFVSLRGFFDSGYSVRSLEVAVEFLKNLACDERVVEFIVNEGFLVRIVELLSCGVLGVRVQCAKAVFRLGCNAKARRELGELGCIGPLIGMLDGKAIEEKQAAVRALSAILVCSGNRRIYRKEERGIVSVVQLLDPSIPNFDKKYPVSILMSLTHSKKCRKQMVNAGALLFLQKLVEMDVDGAKKLQETISRGKLWGVFG
ncbi:hypothetical protein CTI12_AA126680 [Artemisia annua]|uniref:DUF7032 domain-containing protein n=1 Tax=Artemisia annua TaxID=35608 RepID=A0A2U1PPV8_ARTAN|nr:hypothetical protein CTI12_AA126680 [Artemisia annua]